MIEICKEEDKDKIYDARYIKQLLKSRYGDFIWFSEEVGKESLIYFKNMAEYIIKESKREKYMHKNRLMK